MHDYLLSVEIVRFAFIAGVAVSMMLYERRHLTTGSIVVPGYLAIFLIFPSVIVATIANAFISYAFVNKVLPRWFLLYGRTKFTVLAVVSISIQAAMLKLSPSGPWLWENDVPLFVGVGYVIPALIAHDMGRQGIAKTMKSIALAAVLVATPIIVALLAHVPGVNDLSPLEGFGATHVAA
ncbi:MAG: capC, partial [Acidimicrobiaceae bacterium]